MSIDPAHAAGVRGALLGQLNVEHRTMISVIEHLPEGRLNFAPDARLRSFGVLALHVYAGGCRIADFMESGEPARSEEQAEQASTRAELIVECERLNREFANRVNALAPEALARILDFPGIGPFPAVAYIGHHLNHLIHHRAQLAMYLRLMGAKVPPIYGPTLDYE
jgi:uncharacterized damage-inducible protein DinB